MKIKKNKKPVKKLANSGDSTQNVWTNGTGPTSGKSTAISGWGNLSTDTAKKNQTNGALNASSASGYAAAAASALAPLWGNQDTSNFATRQDSGVTSKVFGSVKEIGKAVPIVGGFVQAGDMLGKGLEVGINASNKKGNDAAASTAAFAQGLVDPIAEHQKIAELGKKGVISKGEQAGFHMLNFLGPMPGISNAILEKKYKKQMHPELYQTDPIQDYNQKFFSRPNEPMEAAFGGSLEHYNLPKHSELPNSFANAQMDGKGVQLEKNETLLKFPHGGGNSDYAFSPNLGFDKKGVATTNEKAVKLTFADASKKIENKKTFGFDRANAKSQEFAFSNLKNVAEATRIEKEGNNTVPIAKNGKSGNSLMNYPKKHGQPLGWNPDTNMLPSTGKYPANPELKTLDADAYNNLYTDSQLNISDNTKHKLKYKKTNEEKSRDGTKMAPGDIAQLVGSAVAPIGNLAMYLGTKSEKVNAQLDPTQYSDPRIAKNFNPFYLAEAAARQNINDGSQSDAVRRANLAGLTSTIANKAQDYSLGVDAHNAQAMLGRDQLVSGTSRFNAQMRDRAADLQAQNDARRRQFLTTGLGQTGQAGVEVGKAMNATRTTDIYGNILANYAPDYTMDTKGNLVFKKAYGGNLKLKKKKK